MLKNLEIVDSMREIADRHGKAVSAVAIRFILDYLPKSVALVGAKRPSQIQGNLEALDWVLTKEEINILDKISRD